MTEGEVTEIIATELNLGTVGETVIGYGEIPEWTSASHMNVILALEERLGTEFSADEIVEMTTPAKIAAIVAKRG